MLANLPQPSPKVKGGNKEETMLTWWDREVMNMLDSLVKKKVKAKLKEKEDKDV